MSFQNPSVSKVNDNAAETTTSGPSNLETSGQESMDAFTKMQHKFDSLMGKSVSLTNFMGCRQKWSLKKKKSSRRSSEGTCMKCVDSLWCKLEHQKWGQNSQNFHPQHT